jgi:hypothetical protein
VRTNFPYARSLRYHSFFFSSFSSFRSPSIVRTPSVNVDPDLLLLDARKLYTHSQTMIALEHFHGWHPRNVGEGLSQTGNLASRPPRRTGRNRGTHAA